jgi:hypothetical protein
LGRPAEQLTRLIEDKWNIKTIILDILSDESLPTQCAVVEIRTPSWQFESAGLRAVHLDDIGASSLGNSDRNAISSILSGGNADTGPFSRLGWIEEAQSWIETAVSKDEVTFTSDLRHLNAGGDFCLLRLGTVSGSAYWLKAVGGSNIREFNITTYLAEHCPQYLPRVIAVRKDWNAWVMEEFGSSLHKAASLAEFESAVRGLALLQQHLVGRSNDLLEVRCGDHRMPTLISHIGEVIDYLNESMSLQTERKVPQLSSIRLSELGDLLFETCSALQDLGIPDSVMHNDISPGSILSDGVNCVFTDWCEAYVGNPFITLEQLCVHAARKTSEPELWVQKLRGVYKSCWNGFLTELQIDRAIHLVPLVSVFSYLYGRGDWLRSSRRNEPVVQSYSRSLARHMDRIASSQQLAETLC